MKHEKGNPLTRLCSICGNPIRFNSQIFHDPDRFGTTHLECSEGIDKIIEHNRRNAPEDYKRLIGEVVGWRVIEGVSVDVVVMDFMHDVDDGPCLCVRPVRGISPSEMVIPIAALDPASRQKYGNYKEYWWNQPYPEFLMIKTAIPPDEENGTVFVAKWPPDGRITVCIDPRKMWKHKGELVVKTNISREVAKQLRDELAAMLSITEMEDGK